MQYGRVLCYNKKVNFLAHHERYVTIEAKNATKVDFNRVILEKIDVPIWMHQDVEKYDCEERNLFEDGCVFII